MKTTPKVSVIMAAYNAEKFIGYAIQSVLNQTFSDFELRVVGDCCTDNTEQVVSSFNDERIHWYNLPHNVGSQGIPNSEGLKRAKGELIAYLSHDDLWFPWHLAQLMAYLQKTDCDWVHSSGFAILPNHHVDFMGSLPVGFDYQSYFVAPSLWLHKKNKVEEAGNWPHHYQTPTYIDQDLQIRMAKFGHKMSASKEPSVIKFQAIVWKSLSKQTQYFPQVIYLQKIITQPEVLQLELLKQVANQHGQTVYARYWGGLSALEALKILIWRPLRRWVIIPAQNNIPWFRKLMIARMLRYRRRRAQQTGEVEHKTIHLNLNH